MYEKLDFELRAGDRLSIATMQDLARIEAELEALRKVAAAAEICIKKCGFAGYQQIDSALRELESEIRKVKEAGYSE